LVKEGILSGFHNDMKAVYDNCGTKKNEYRITISFVNKTSGVYPYKKDAINNSIKITGAPYS
jgi:hypothetical protein